MHKTIAMSHTELDPITSSEACDILDIDRSTLTRWVAAGQISPLKKLPGIRGPFIFDPQEIARIKEARDAA